MDMKIVDQYDKVYTHCKTRDIPIPRIGEMIIHYGQIYKVQNVIYDYGYDSVRVVIHT